MTKPQGPQGPAARVAPKSDQAHEPRSASTRRVIPAAVAALATLGLAAWTAYPWARRPDPAQGPDASLAGGLTVLHGGRLMPLDTVAANSLLVLSGRRAVSRQGGRAAGALEWLLTLMARPREADAWPIFLVDEPDLRGLLGLKPGGPRRVSFNDLGPLLAEIESQAASAAALEGRARSRFQAAVLGLRDRLSLYDRLKHSLQATGTDDLGREIALYRAVLPAGVEAVFAHQGGGPFDVRALGAIGAFFRRYKALDQTAAFRPLPPESGEAADGWATMGEGLLQTMRTGRLRPGIEEWAGLLAAWRDQDAAAFSRAAGAWRARLDERAPRARRWSRLEAAFNAAEPFTKGMALYVAAFLLAAASWILWPETLARAAHRVLWLAFAVHTAGLAARMLIHGRPPVTNLYSSAVFVGWVAVLLGLVLEHAGRRGIGAAVAGAVGFATLLIAHNLAAGGDTLGNLQAVLDSNFWLGTHVVTITIGYAGTFLAGALAHVYILRGLLARGLSRGAARELARMTYGVVAFSLFFSFVGTVLGGIWADQSWGRFWGWDPKENGALLILLWNAIILHSRWGGFIRERGLMVMAVFGNVVTALSWFGVNMLGIGLHSYGWMDQASLWLAAFTASQLAVMALGAA